MSKQRCHFSYDVALPKFRIESSASLSLILSGMGVIDMFDDDRANFKGISQQRPLYVSGSANRAVLEVGDKDGGHVAEEAAAAGSSSSSGSSKAHRGGHITCT